MLVSSAGWGSMPVLVKLAIGAGADVWALAAWRYAGAAGLLWLVMIAARRRPPPLARWPRLFALGAVFGGSTLCFLLGLRWIPASTAILLFFTYPAVVLLLAGLMRLEALTSRRLACAGLAVTGGLLTAGGGLAGGRPAGVALVLLSVGFVSAYVLMSHFLMVEEAPLGAATISVTATGAVTVAAALVAGPGGLALGGGATAVRLVALVTLTGTAVPVVAWLAGIRLLGPGKASLYSTMEPLVTVALAAVVLGEGISWSQGLGGLLVLAGVSWLRLEPAPQGSERGLELEGL